MISIVKQLKNELKKVDNIETVFIGGGTPSCVDAHLYKDFFRLIKPYLSKDCEITTEANPNSATSPWIKQMQDFGVNRVSLGVQSFNEEKLKLLGRAHSSDEAIKAIELVAKTGIKHISIDLIYGTKQDTKELLQKDLDIAFNMPIDHISCYSLTIEENTKFAQTPQIANDDEMIAFWFAKEIQKRGFTQYEISNFGTYQCIHNLGYWQYKNYIGVGSSAVGFVHDKRFYSSSNLEEYIKNPLLQKVEKLSLHDIKTEKILLGLRSIIGFCKDILNESELKKTNELVSEKKLVYKSSYFYNNNYFLSDELALYILRDS